MNVLHRTPPNTCSGPPESLVLHRSQRSRLSRLSHFRRLQIDLIDTNRSLYHRSLIP